MFTIRVPLDDTADSRAPVQRPDSEHTARLLRDGVEITAEQFEDPPSTYSVVDGEVHVCDDCGALFASQPALAGHSASHSEE
jgi:hypothetical protein